MRGSLGRIALREEYRRAEVLCFLPAWKDRPEFLLEAAASGLPVIARKDYETGICDRRKKTGFLVSEDDEDDGPSGATPRGS